MNRPTKVGAAKKRQATRSGRKPRPKKKQTVARSDEGISLKFERELARIVPLDRFLRRV